MAAEQSLAAVAQLLEDRQFDAVGEALDQAELEARDRLPGVVGRPAARSSASLRLSPLPAGDPEGGSADADDSAAIHAPAPTPPPPRSPQEPGALSSEQWPHALHLLAHVYAGRL